MPGPSIVFDGLNLSFLAESCRLGAVDIAKMISELRAERERVEQAIVLLERIAVGTGPKRGRPPAWMTRLKTRGRPKGSKNKPKD